MVCESYQPDHGERAWLETQNLCAQTDPEFKSNNKLSIDKYIGEIIALSLSGTSSYDPFPKGLVSMLSTGIANALPLHTSLDTQKLLS